MHKDNAGEYIMGTLFNKLETGQPINSGTSSINKRIQTTADMIKALEQAHAEKHETAEQWAQRHK